MEIEKIFNQYSTSVENFGKILIRNFSKEQNPIKKQELAFTTLIYFLKKNKYETQEMKKIFIELQCLTKFLEKKLNKNYKNNKNISRKIMLDVFYKTNIYKLFIIESLYDNINITQKSDKMRVLRKNLEKKGAIFEKDYKKYFSLTAHKLLTNYWTSFWYLLIITLIITVVFGAIFYISDSLTPLISPDNTLRTIDYYIYVSVSTISNLGGDVDMAGNLFLRIIFAIEQIIWVGLFWVCVILAGRKV